VEEAKAVPALDESKVKAALDEVRGLLQADGGDVDLVGIEGKVVKVRMKGHCGSCPFAQITLQRGIEARVRAAVPEVERVIAVP